MSVVAEIEDRIRRLKAEELAEFRAWFREFDAHEWDEQIADDLRSGRLDRLIEEATADRAAGKAREL